MSETNTADAGTAAPPSAGRVWVKKVLKVAVAAKSAPKLVMAATRTAQPKPQAPPQPMQPAQPTGAATGAKPAGPAIGGQRSPERVKEAYEKRLADAQPQIVAARKLGTMDGAKAGLATMESSLTAAASAAQGADYRTANTSLDAALAAVTTASGAAKAACEARLDTLQKRLAKVKTTVDALKPANTAANSAIATAEGVGKTAELAMVLEPEDWPDAVLKLDAFETALTTLGESLATAAQGLLDGFKQRLATAASGRPVGGNVLKLRGACAAANKKLAGLIAAKDGTGALEACADAEKAVKALEDAAAPDGTAKTKMVTDAESAVSALSDTDLAAKPMTEKAQLAFDLCANGPPRGDALEQLTRIYRKSPPTPQFLTERDQQRTKIAEKVSKLPGVSKLFKADGSTDTAEWQKILDDPAKAKALLQTVNDEQMKILGLPSTPVTTFIEEDQDNGDGTTSTSFGAYNPGSKKINLNAHPDAMRQPQDALITILHESFHAQQDALVAKLLAGEIAPDDPIYPQVMMFAANFPPGYLPPEADQADYEAQPIEIDAETEGTKAAVAVRLAVKSNKSAASGAATV